MSGKSVCQAGIVCASKLIRYILKVKIIAVVYAVFNHRGILLAAIYDLRSVHTACATAVMESVHTQCGA